MNGKHKRDFISRVGGISTSRLERILEFIVSEHVYMRDNRAMFGYPTGLDMLKTNAMSTRGVAIKMDISKSSAYRDVKFMVENGYMKFSSATPYRSNSKKHFYRMTHKALALATEILESAE